MAEGMFFFNRDKYLALHQDGLGSTDPGVIANNYLLNCKFVFWVEDFKRFHFSLKSNVCQHPG